MSVIDSNKLLSYGNGRAGRSDCLRGGVRTWEYRAHFGNVIQSEQESPLIGLTLRYLSFTGQFHPRWQIEIILHEKCGK